MPEVVLRPAYRADLDFIVALESRPDMADRIFRWPRARHEAGLEDPDAATLLFEGSFDGSEVGPIGYAILRGLQSPHASIELMRLAVARSGAGLGTAVMALLMRHVFEELGANRLWLDVFEDNAPARRFYRKMGFVEEGLLRQAWRRGDGFVSLSIMSRLREEYLAGKQAV